MATTTVGIYGLKEVKDKFSKEKLKDATAKSLAIAVIQLHNSLKSAVFRRYTARNNLDKQLVRRSSIVSFGKGIVESGLIYNVQINDLSKFPTTWYWGNINPADRKGRVHTVTIIRGNKKVSHGKDQRGGFQPRDSRGKVSRIFNKGSQMFERTSSKKLPLRVLYGPNTANMINWALHNDKSVHKVIDALELNIIDNFI